MKWAIPSVLILLLFVVGMVGIQPRFSPLDRSASFESVSHNSPTIHCVSEVDLGECEIGETAQTFFTIRNDGIDDLVIEEHQLHLRFPFAELRIPIRLGSEGA